MNSPLFITGLPRSRTAWFATLLTWGDVMVGHDVPYDALTTAFDNGTLQGHSCASNLLQWRDLYARYPRARWVVIDRPFMQCYRASKAIAPATTYGGFCGLYRELEELKATLKPLVIPFDAIDTARCYLLATYLGTDIGPPPRVTQLLNMQVQLHPKVLAERLAALQQKEAA